MNKPLSDLQPSAQTESKKNRRREAILTAARELFRETGEDGLSMRGLAKRANVSLATPYNHFGSKQGVILALLNRESDQFLAEFQYKESDDSIARIFDFVDLSFDLYATDPVYFKALLLSLSRSEDAELRQGLRKPRAAFLKRLLRDSLGCGDLKSDVSIGLVGRSLFGIYLFFIQEWTYGIISLDRARMETEFNYSVVLLALAADHTREKLLERNRRLEAMLD